MSAPAVNETTKRSSPLSSLSGTILALLVSLGAATLLLLFFATPVDSALLTFFFGPLSSTLSLGNFFNESLVLTITGLAAAIAFSAGSFNLGGEGQIYTGALAAVALSLALPPSFGPLGILCALLIGTATGSTIGGLSGILKARWGADEMITTFLISAALLPLTDALITSPWLSDPNSFLITTKNIPEEFRIPGLLEPSNFHWGILIALPLAFLFSILLFSTPWGYRLRITGRNRAFAQYAGISVGRFSFLPLAISGGLNGLVGSLGALGTQHALIQSFSFGWGWNGIAVALIARNHPLVVIPAALFFAYLDQSSRLVVLQGQFPFQLSALFQAFILFFITAQLFAGWRKR